MSNIKPRSHQTSASSLLRRFKTTSRRTSLSIVLVVAACAREDNVGDPPVATSPGETTSAAPTATATSEPAATSVGPSGTSNAPNTSSGGSGASSEPVTTVVDSSADTLGTVGSTSEAVSDTTVAQNTTGTDVTSEAPYEGPEMLSQTGLFTQRSDTGELVLGEGVREFEPKYWLWSDGSGKKRYVYLPPGTKINTADPDHWVFPKGTKFWKSFLSGEQLVETRLIEFMGDANEVIYATYYWAEPDAVDAKKMKYKNLLLNAAGTTHDIPNGQMCEKCHNALEDKALGFAALQLNHDKGGLDLATLLSEELLTDPISLDIKMPGDDQLTQDALGYLHANCGNCHNDSPGLPLESVPAPQMYLRALVGDQMLEDTGVFKSAINQKSTASSELAVEYRIAGGDIPTSAVHFRMTQRMIEDQMPPIGTEVKDETGLELIQTWIESLPPPAP